MTENQPFARDLRAAIRAEVAGIRPFDPREAADRAAALDWIDSGAALCRQARPATPPMHLVSYFLVIDGDSVLLVDHRNAGLWLPTGGHMEPGEHPRDTVRREVREELGIAAAFLREAAQFVSMTRTVGASAGHVDVSLWYALAGRRDQALDWDRNEFHGVCWFEAGAVPFERAEPELRGFLAKGWNG